MSLQRLTKAVLHFIDSGHMIRSMEAFRLHSYPSRALEAGQLILKQLAGGGWAELADTVRNARQDTIEFDPIPEQLPLEPEE